MGLLIDPFISFDLIDRDQMNHHLVEWEHQHGAINRPTYKEPIDFALRIDGRPVAVIAADSLIRETCDLTRNDAFELSRLCSAPGHRGISSLAMRMWRAFAYTAIVRAWNTPWVISYQDATRHVGNLYRYDGWLILGYSSGGADPRAAEGTVTARKRVIWGWHADADARAARREVRPAVPRWAA